MGGRARAPVVGSWIELRIGSDSLAPTIVIRAAGTGDIRSVSRIEMESFGDPWGDADFEQVLGVSHAIFLVAASDVSEAVLGYAISLSVLDESEILNLAVDPAFRGRGFGGMLLDSSLSELDSRGAEMTFLEVRESNLAARALYASRGFQELSRRRGYYRQPPEDALVLRRAVQR